MYQDKIKSIGEHSSAAEELLNEVPELEQKCRAVEKSVKEGYFTLEEALHNYSVSEIEYIPYLLLRYNEKLKKAKKQSQLFDTINAIVSIFNPSSNSFDIASKKALADIKKISEKVSPNEKILVK